MSQIWQHNLRLGVLPASLHLYSVTASRSTRHSLVLHAIECHVDDAPINLLVVVLLAEYLVEGLQRFALTEQTGMQDASTRVRQPHAILTSHSRRPHTLAQAPQTHLHSKHGSSLWYPKHQSVSLRHLRDTSFRYIRELPESTRRLPQPRRLLGIPPSYTAIMLRRIEVTASWGCTIPWGLGAHQEIHHSSIDACTIRGHASSNHIH